MPFSSSKKYLLVLIIILAIASFFRLWQINQIPPGLYPDEAINANQAVSNHLKIFYPENNGREGLFVWLIHFFFSAFGISIASLRFTSAVFGILTVLGLYLLTKEMFRLFFDEKKTEIIALLSAFFLSISFWHTNFSRIGFRAILVPFFLVFSFYFLFQSFRKKSYVRTIIAGIFFGLGFYTYIAFRFSVLLLLILLACLWIVFRKKSAQKTFIIISSLFLLTTFLVALPIGIYFIGHPQYFVSRAVGISVFNQENPVKATIESAIKHAFSFNFSGDKNWRHNISGRPELFLPIGILFLMGLFYSLFEIFQSIFKKNWLQFSLYLFLISWWAIMMLPGILTYEGIPHSLRIIGSIIPAYIFAAVGFFVLWELFLKATKINQRKAYYQSLAVILIVLAIPLILLAYKSYFIVWAKNPNTRGAFTRNLVEIGRYLNSLPENTKKYVIVNQPGVLVNGIPMPSQTVMFMEKTKYKTAKSTYLTEKDLNKINPEKNTVIVPLSPDKNLFLYLKTKFPNGKIEKYKDFWSYKIIKN